MIDESVKRILSAPISFLCPATKEERAVFTDKANGWFYTFGLKSGQSFVAHLDKEDAIFTFRPLNNLIPHLVQFQWKQKRVFDAFSSWFDTICQIKPGLSEVERNLLSDTLSPKIEEYKESPTSPRVIRHHYPVMLEKAWGLQKQLATNDHLRQSLIKGQQALQSLLICRDAETRNPAVQQNNQERR